MNPSEDTPQSQNDAAMRQAVLLEATKCILFEIDVPDRECDCIKLFIHGVIETNEFFVKLTNRKTVFVDVVELPQINPSMGDRIGGKDRMEAEVIFVLPTRLWEANNDTLILR